MINTNNSSYNNPRLLIIGFVWPEPKSSAAGSRMMQLIDAFLAENYKITFASPCAKSDNAFNLGTIGVSQETITLNDSSFDDFVKILNPNVVMFDRFMMEEQFGWRVAEQCPQAIRILDTEDLHSLRKGRQQAFKEGKPFDIFYVFNATAKREIASIYRSDLSLIISEAEINILKMQFKVPEELLWYLPFMCDAVSEGSSTKFSERTDFMTIGNFVHEPNYNMVLYLKETLWPLIRKQLPKARLHVYGAYASQKVNQLHNEKNGFLIKGFIEDVNIAMQQARVCLSPIRFGAGLKGKLIDAMLNGTPCVTTKIGAEGMYGDLEPNGFITDSPEDFVNKAVALYQDETLWYNKQNLGYHVVNTRFKKMENQKKLFSAIAELRDKLQERRHHNFTGQMLQHHSMQSTKFMSRWIEEKQKK